MVPATSTGSLGAKFDPRVTAKYDIKALIGRGSFSRVVRVEHRATRQPYAIKMIETKYREGREVCESELRVLRRVRHANIIQLVEVFETQAPATSPACHQSTQLNLGTTAFL